MTHVKASQLMTREVVVVLDNANGKSQSIACRFLRDVSAKNSITNHTPSFGGVRLASEGGREALRQPLLTKTTQQVNTGN
jgi:hypothetical protein